MEKSPLHTNIRRRKLLLAAGALLAAGNATLVRANSRTPKIAYVNEDNVSARGNFEKMRRALEHRFVNARIKPELIFVSAALNRSQETVMKLRIALESLQPAIVIAPTITYAEMVRDLKPGLPVLFFYLGNPVARGLADSLTRPALGMTGYVLGPGSLVKRREMLLRLVPQCRVLGIYDLEFEPGPVPYNDSIIENDPFTRLTKRFFYFSTLPEFEKFAHGPEVRSVDAWDIPWSRFAVLYGEAMTREFARIRMPVIYPRLHFLKLGGMSALQPNTDDMHEVFAGQAAALLDGVPLENIPIVQSTRYNFGLNLAALRQVGINPPKSLIKVADMVIQ
ncbi:MAG TPA: ABC transporter substrate binding protein [Usitatibacteraceae bacterium]